MKRFILLMLPFLVTLPLAATLSESNPAWADEAQNKTDSPNLAVDQIAISPNSFEGTDVERINRAIHHASSKGLRVVIPRRNKTQASDRDVWLLDSAILVQDNTILELNNCHIKLSDRCRDNMIRSANCGLGVANIRPMSQVHIYGVGNVLLEGADHRIHRR
jgi:hypothetical protein